MANVGTTLVREVRIMTDNTKNTKAKQHGSATIEEPRKTYLPGMGHDWLLPLYTPLQRLLGFEPIHRQLVDQADIGPNHHVIEIGCGTGALSILIKRLHPQAEVVGLDPDPKALARAQRKAECEALSVQLDRGSRRSFPIQMRRSSECFPPSCFTTSSQMRRRRHCRRHGGYSNPVAPCTCLTSEER